MGPSHARRVSQRSVAPDEGGAVAAVGVRRRVDGGEGDPIPVFGVVAIPGDQGLDFVIPVRHDLHLGGFAVLAQCPLHVVRKR